MDEEWARDIQQHVIDLNEKRLALRAALQLVFAEVPGLRAKGLARLAKVEDLFISLPVPDDRLARVKQEFLEIVQPPRRSRAPSD
jgi:hypothetical protein